METTEVQKPRRAQRARRCRECGSTAHDVRTCPKAKQAKRVEKSLARSTRKRAPNGNAWLQGLREQLEQLDALKRALAKAGFHHKP